MSSINNIISKAFEEQVLKWLDECSNTCNHNKKYILTYIKVDGENGYIQMWFDDNSETLYIQRYFNTHNNILAEIQNFCIYQLEGEDEEGDYLDLLAEEITRLVKVCNTNEEWCECGKPMEFKSEKLDINTIRHSTIRNYCEDCVVNKHLINLNTLVNKGIDLEDYCCDICKTSCVEKVSESTINYTELLKLRCCKNKIMCMSCKDKCNNDCPFCRQKLKWTY